MDLLEARRVLETLQESSGNGRSAEALKIVISHLETVNHLDDIISRQGETINRRAETIRELTDTVRLRDVLITEHEKTIAELKLQIKSSNDFIFEKGHVVGSLKDQISKLQHQLGIAAGKDSDYRKRIGQLQSDLREKEIEINKLKFDLNREQQKVALLNKPWLDADADFVKEVKPLLARWKELSKHQIQPGVAVAYADLGQFQDSLTQLQLDFSNKIAEIEKFIRDDTRVSELAGMLSADDERIKVMEQRLKTLEGIVGTTTSGVAVHSITIDHTGNVINREKALVFVKGKPIGELRNERETNGVPLADLWLFNPSGHSNGAVDLRNIPIIGSDGRCQCTCLHSCPKGKTGMEHRCTKEELDRTEAYYRMDLGKEGN